MAKLTKSLGKICEVWVISVNAVFLTSIFCRIVTNFWQVQNVKRGKLMAKEYPGILLCMAAVLRSTRGRNLLQRKSLFKDKGVLIDWLTLLETLLQWEMWLKSDAMQRKHVESAKQKHRYIMYLVEESGQTN